MKKAILALTVSLTFAGAARAQSTDSTVAPPPTGKAPTAKLNLETRESQEWGIPVIIDSHGAIRPNFKKPIKQFPSARTISPTSAEATLKPKPETQAKH